MKIFGYEFRKFEEKTTTLETIETWVVEWESIYHDWGSYYKSRRMFKTFIDKAQAEMFAKELHDARKLLGDTGVEVGVYKQSSPTNK